MATKQKGGGSRKIDRNKAECKRYRDEGRREKNAVRHARRVRLNKVKLEALAKKRMERFRLTAEIPASKTGRRLLSKALRQAQG